MLADRGVEVDHTTMSRWVQRFAPELEKRTRRHLRPCRGPWHVDETYLQSTVKWRDAGRHNGRFSAGANERALDRLPGETLARTASSRASCCRS